MRPIANQQRTRAFSLIELVIVVVIIGIIAAIAIPRLSRGAEGAADSALIADLAVMRNAIDLYETEHTGTMPTVLNFEDELLLYSDISGTTNSAKGGAFIYGPYLRGVPPLPVGQRKGDMGVKAPPADGLGTEGWVYDQGTGEIRANCAGGETDDAGTPYNTY
jgi:prepilin-type N-terminal cleavage/methylation domain-containing protein